MSVLETPDAARASAEPKLGLWKKLGQALSRDDNPYSPLSCIIMALIAGLVIKMGPTIHEFLAQN
jgi:hypothetical protein